MKMNIWFNLSSLNWIITYIIWLITLHFSCILSYALLSIEIIWNRHSKGQITKMDGISFLNLVINQWSWSVFIRKIRGDAFFLNSIRFSQICVQGGCLSFLLVLFLSPTRMLLSILCSQKSRIMTYIG